MLPDCWVFTEFIAEIINNYWNGALLQLLYLQGENNMPKANYAGKPGRQHYFLTKLIVYSLLNISFYGIRPLL